MEFEGTLLVLKMFLPTYLRILKGRGSFVRVDS